MDKHKSKIGHSLKTVAIIPAAGAGARMGKGRPKQFMELNGKPLLTLTLKVFQEAKVIDSIIPVVSSEDIEYCRREIVERFRLDKVEKVVRGGDRRQDSVRLGIEASEGAWEIVMIHDGVRPLIQPSLIDKVAAEARVARAVITAMPAKDTVKRVDNEGLVERTYERKRIWLVQTPQAFRYEDIHRAHQQAFRENWEEMTDDALLMERMEIPVKVIKGSENNIKITTPHDLELARCLIDKQAMK